MWAEMDDKSQSVGTYLIDGGFSIKDRLIYLTVPVVSSTAILLGRMVTPSPDGVGTHQQLGLPACLMLTLTGIPCPSCGLTTSFSHAAHLEFSQAMHVQPFGLLIFLLAVASIPISILIMTRQKPFSDLLFSRSANLLMYSLLSLYIVSWIYKIILMNPLAR